MTNNARIHEENGKWYYWPDSWTAAKGPFEDYISAHMALTQYLEAQGGDKKTLPEQTES